MVEADSELEQAPELGNMLQYRLPVGPKPFTAFSLLLAAGFQKDGNKSLCTPAICTES